MATNSGQFSKSVLTTTGKEMIAQSQNGLHSHSRESHLATAYWIPVALKAVKWEKLSAEISSFTDKGNGQFTVHFNVNNRKLTKGFFHREISLMAKIDEEEEQLYTYSYASTAASFLYDNTTPIQVRVVNFDFLIGDDERPFLKQRKEDMEIGQYIKYGEVTWIVTDVKDTNRAGHITV